MAQRRIKYASLPIFPAPCQGIQPRCAVVRMAVEIEQQMNLLRLEVLKPIDLFHGNIECLAEVPQARKPAVGDMNRDADLQPMLLKLAAEHFKIWPEPMKRIGRAVYSDKRMSC